MLIGSPQNHLSQLLLSNIWFALQPKAFQINNQEEVAEIGSVMAANA